MQLALVGVGQAGGKLVDAVLDFDARTGSHVVRAALAVNTAKPDLQGLEYVPQEHSVLVGQSRVSGHGAARYQP